MLPEAPDAEVIAETWAALRDLAGVLHEIGQDAAAKATLLRGLGVIVMDGDGVRVRYAERYAVFGQRLGR